MHSLKKEEKTSLDNKSFKEQNMKGRQMTLTSSRYVYGENSIYPYGRCQMQSANSFETSRITGQLIIVYHRCFRNFHLFANSVPVHFCFVVCDYIRLSNLKLNNISIKKIHLKDLYLTIFGGYKTIICCNDDMFACPLLINILIF